MTSTAPASAPGPRQIAAAALSGLALSHTVGVAVLAGLVTSDKPFFRTPKQAPRHALLKALACAREEWLITIALLLAAWGVSSINLMGSPDRTVWILVLLIQTVPYLAAIVMSLVSALPLPASLVGLPTPTRHQEPAEGRGRRAAILCAPEGPPNIPLK